MDKASDFGSEDCRFESCHGRIPFDAYVSLSHNLRKYSIDTKCKHKSIIFNKKEMTKRAPRRMQK